MLGASESLCKSLTLGLSSQDTLESAQISPRWEIADKLEVRRD